MSSIAEIAIEALDRIAAGKPAFDYEPFSTLERAKRRDALKLLRTCGYIETVETGERAELWVKLAPIGRGYKERRPVFTDLRLPRVTEAGWAALRGE
jgi:hypothetical protein